MCNDSWHVSLWLMVGCVWYFLERLTVSKPLLLSWQHAQGDPVTSSSSPSIRHPPSGQWPSSVCRYWPAMVVLALSQPNASTVIASVTGCHGVISYTDIRWKTHTLDSWSPWFNSPWSLNQGARDCQVGHLLPCPSIWYTNRFLQ